MTLWTVAHWAPLSIGFSRQEYWSGFPCSSPGDLPDPGIELASPVAPELQVDSLPLSQQGTPKTTIPQEKKEVKQRCSTAEAWPQPDSMGKLWCMIVL